MGKSQPINKKTKERVVTQSNEKILEGIGKILIVKKNLIKLEVNASPDTIETGEKSRIKVRLINKEGEEITISDDTEITLTLDEEGSRLGRLESRNNSGQTITVRAEEIKNGEVKYIANNTIQSPNALIKINNKERLKLMGNEEIKGIATITATIIYEGKEIEGNTKITIKEADKKIEIILEPEEVRPLGTGGNNKTKVKVKVTRSEKGIKDIGIELRAEAEEGSGGHDHRGNRPAGKFKDNITVGKTDENGVYETEYTASEFGGIEKIIAKIAGSGKETEAKLTVRVEGLELLPESPYYVKIGGTCNHHGPSDREIPTECMDKDNNHWGTPNVIKNIENIAKEYRRIFPNLSLLAINDISLSNGGKFDINGQWKGSHTYHRVGLDVDVRSTNMPGDRFIDRNRNDEYDKGDILIVDINRNGKYDNNVIPVFKSIAEDYGVYKVNLEYPGRNNEHWHLYFWDINRR
ncbi:MAG: penicillin-insensitive murein endopeptidase [Melioribacteraceae bacterium]